MSEKELYENQYGESKLVNRITFPRLRKVLKSYDLHREDACLGLLDGGDRLLDVGCGDGTLLFKVAGSFNELHGIDISTARIRKAEREAGKKFGRKNKFNFTSFNANERLPFDDSTFDAVTCVAVIEHVFDPYFIVTEINRVLKPGGVFVSEVPNIGYIRHRLALLFGRLPVTSSPYNWKEIGWDGGHLHYFTEKALCGLFTECGFKVTKVTGSGLLAGLRNFHPSLLTGDLCVKAQKL